MPTPPALPSGSSSDAQVHPRRARPAEHPLHHGGDKLKQALSKKEAEAIVWVLAEIIDASEDYIPGRPTEPLAVIYDAGFPPWPTREAAEKLEKMVFTGEIKGPLSPLDCLILRTCVENSTWIEGYRTREPTAHSSAHINEALATLRDLAAKLEDFGIEVSRIPFE